MSPRNPSRRYKGNCDLDDPLHDCMTFLMLMWSSIILFKLMLIVDSLGHDVHVVNPEVVVAGLLVDMLVDLLALDALVFDCEVYVLIPTLYVANLLDDSILFFVANVAVHFDVFAIPYVDVLEQFLLFLRCLLVFDVIGHPNDVDVDATPDSIPVLEVDAANDVHPLSNVDHDAEADVTAQAVVRSGVDVVTGPL